jgi:hypothetical protein
MQIGISQLVKRVETQLNEVRDVFLEKMAEKAIMISPVDTGAYVTSFTVTTISGGGRSKTSHGKPRGQDAEAKKSEAFDQVLGDIAALPLDVTKVYLTNRAPHAKAVEDDHGYGVFGVVRNVASYLLDEAVSEVRFRE